MILTYNPFVVFSNIPEFRELGLVDPSFSDAEIAHYADVPTTSKHPLIDRSGGMKHFLPITNVTPFPEVIPGFSKSFEQIALERAQELIATGKRINVLWSGGIDSTAVLLSLINKCYDKNQIRVLLTYDSIVESGGLFDRHIHNQVPYVLNTRLPKNLFFKQCDFSIDNDLIVTGCGADQVLNSMPFSKELSAEFLEFIKPAIDRSPRPLVTKEDYEWYIRFNFIWASVMHSLPFGLDKKFAPMITTFYGSDDFQRWAIQGENQIDFSPEHKNVARKLIHKLSNEHEYAFYKPKSWSTFSSNEYTTKAFLDVSGQTIYINKN